MTNLLNKKFWTFKDTQNYSYVKELRMLGKPDVLRTFIFKKSFLLEIHKDGETHYVIPTKFVSKVFPDGFYFWTPDVCMKNQVSFFTIKLSNYYAPTIHFVILKV